ncbi:MAG TPA: acetyl-CoA decarbonylase/synthase complex subunit gamma, partial [Anaerolineae bacterium]
MALSGIQIYKLLPQTNCKECGFPTCLAFAMKLAAKQVELSACPYVSDTSKAQLAESAAPPMRLVTLKSDGHEVKVGNEVVLFRHEKTFYNKPGLFIRVRDDEDVKAKVEPADKFAAAYVGMDLTIDGFAVEATGEADRFVAAIKAVRAISKRPLILISRDPKVIGAGLAALGGEAPLIDGADATNWEAMAGVAKQYKAPLVVNADSIEGFTDLTEKIKSKGVEDLVIDPAAKNLSQLLTVSTQLRRLALKKNVRSVGYPLLVSASDTMLATQAIAKYAGFVVLAEFKPETVYPLLVLRQNIYTDPQKPIQVLPGLYEINNPKPESP